MTTLLGPSPVQLGTEGLDSQLALALYRNFNSTYVWPSLPRPTMYNPIVWQLTKRSKFVTSQNSSDNLQVTGHTVPPSQANLAPLDWLLGRTEHKGKASFTDRILARLIQSEAHEPNPHLRTDYRISWLTVKWAAEGVSDPHVAATYRVLAVHPNQVYAHIESDRRAKLGQEYQAWFDSKGNLQPQLQISAQSGAEVLGMGTMAGSVPKKVPQSVGRVIEEEEA